MRSLIITVLSLTAFTVNAASISSNFQVRLTVIESCSSTTSKGRVAVYCQGGTQPLVSQEMAISTQNNQGIITVITY